MSHYEAAGPRMDSPRSRAGGAALQASDSGGDALILNGTEDDVMSQKGQGSHRQTKRRRRTKRALRRKQFRNTRRVRA